MLERVERGALALIASPGLEAEKGISIAFTGRRGGRGSGPYADLNISYNVGDDRSVVASNRGVVSSALEMPEADWVLCQQVHGTAVADVGLLEKGRGALDHWSALARTDALVTTQQGIALGVLTADCVPLILVDPGLPAIAVVHAGWRGVLSGIAVRGLERLVKRSGGAPGGILAFIGPHIGPCCMDVGDDVAAMFSGEFGDPAVAGTEGRHTLDLAAACKQQLARSGVKRANIFEARVCTACSDEHFSFRRDPVCGRQMAVACIREGEDA